MNIYDVSKKAGVSIATVSRVLNGSARVSDKMREKVMRVIEDGNYSPNVFARGLSMATMHSVGILYCDASDLYLANAVYHLERYFREEGYVSFLCCCGYDAESRKRYISLMQSKKVDALILAGSHFVEERDEDNCYIEEAAKICPVALLSGNLTYPNVICAYCDDRQAIFEITNKLFKQNAQRIAFLYSVTSNSIREKIMGLRNAYAINRRQYLPDYAIQYVKTGEIQDNGQILELVRSRVFDAIICMDDEVAVSVLKSAQKEKISVPECLKIVGYNNSVLSSCTTPELTTIDNHAKDMCKKLVEMTTACIQGKETPMQYMVNGTIVFRDSTE